MDADFDDELLDEDQEHKEIPLKQKDDIKITVADCRKEGNDWKYDIEVTVNGNKRSYTRLYKDIQWLHRTLTRNIDLGGYIIPPLPPIPSSIPDLPSAAIIGKGDAMFGGLIRRITLKLELFLQALADHEFFYENHIVYNFLVNENLGVHERLGAGTMWSQISKVYSNYSLSGIQDPEEKFDSFFKYVDEMVPNLSNTYFKFSEYIFSWQRLGNNYVLTKAALQDVAVVDKREHSSLAHIENQMAEGLFDIGINECLLSLDAALSLAAVLSYQADYFIHCKEMLQRRLYCLQGLLTANQQLDKAKPEKKEAAEKAKSKAESQFQSISKTAENEVSKFTHQYQDHLKSGLLSYTEAQIAHARRTLESLLQIKDSLLYHSEN